VLKKIITAGVQEAMAVKSVDRLAVLDEGMTFSSCNHTAGNANHRNVLYRRGGAHV
jgi:hypothetical protein